MSTQRYLVGVEVGCRQCVVRVEVPIALQELISAVSDLAPGTGAIHRERNLRPCPPARSASAGRLLQRPARIRDLRARQPGPPGHQRTADPATRQPAWPAAHHGPGVVPRPRTCDPLRPTAGAFLILSPIRPPRLTQSLQMSGRSAAQAVGSSARRHLTGRWDDADLRSSSCRILRPGELRVGQSGRWLPPSLDIPPSYTCGIGIPARLLTVNIWDTLREAILW